MCGSQTPKTASSPHTRASSTSWSQRLPLSSENTSHWRPTKNWPKFKLTHTGTSSCWGIASPRTKQLRGCYSFRSIQSPGVQKMRFFFEFEFIAVFLCFVYRMLKDWMARPHNWKALPSERSFASIFVLLDFLILTMVFPLLFSSPLPHTQFLCSTEILAAIDPSFVPSDEPNEDWEEQLRAAFPRLIEHVMRIATEDVLDLWALIPISFLQSHKLHLTCHCLESRSDLNSLHSSISIKTFYRGKPIRSILTASKSTERSVVGLTAK